MSFQLWEAEDHDHRLHTHKLLEIINLSEKNARDRRRPRVRGRVSRQMEKNEDNTIGKYGLTFDVFYFQMTNQSTDCLSQRQMWSRGAKAERSHICHTRLFGGLRTEYGLLLAGGLKER